MQGSLEFHAKAKPTDGRVLDASGKLGNFGGGFRDSRGSRRCRAGSKEVSGGQGKPRAEEWWPESSGRCLDDDFLIEAFSCQVWSFSVLRGRLQVALGGVELRLRRSQEVRGSPDFQNGGLSACEEASMTTFWLRHLHVKSGRFLSFWGVSRWLQEVSSCVQGGPSKSGEGKSSRMVVRELWKRPGPRLPG